MKGSALRALGQWREAVSVCRSACEQPSSGYLSYMNLAAALADGGEQAEAEQAMARLLELEPSFSYSTCKKTLVGMHELEFASLVGALRRAGMPD